MAEEVKEAPKAPKVLQLAVQQGNINYNGEERKVWIATTGGRQLIFDTKEQAVEMAQNALDEFRS